MVKSLCGFFGHNLLVNITVQKRFSVEESLDFHWSHADWRIMFRHLDVFSVSNSKAILRFYTVDNKMDKSYSLLFRYLSVWRSFKVWFLDSLGYTANVGTWDLA